ncbi:MAG: glycosyltransferase family 4 protein [Candidatus Thermoplasmatota archaeon]|nr:glycosyltransferase family 4 protein [Candidatus Thermoplasmatota archaeon]
MEVVLSIPFHPEKNIGGVGSVSRNLVSGLKNNIDLLEKYDVKINLLSPIDNSNLAISDSKHLTNRSYSVNIHPILTGMHHATKNFDKILKEKKIDIVHSHDPYIALCGIKKNITTFFTLHGVVWEEYKYRNVKIYPYPTMWKLRKIFLKLDKFLAISPYIQDEVNEFFNFPKSKIDIMENPISEDFFQKKDEFQQGLIFFPGVISKRKNQITMCKVINTLKESGEKDFKVIFTGSVLNKNYYRKIKNYINKKRINKYVELKENVPFSVIIDLYKKSNCVVLTSKQETAPMVISESMASSTPIISNNICGAPYMIDHKKDGYLYNDIDGLILYLTEIINDKNRTLKMGIKGNQKALKRWSNNIIANNLINYYYNYEG